MSCLNKEICSGSLFGDTRQSLPARPVCTEVVLGSPSQKCLGPGICVVVPYHGKRLDCVCPTGIAWLSLTPEGNLRMAFQRDSLGAEARERLENSSDFEIVEAYALPRSVLVLLKMDEFVLKSGRYSVDVSDTECILFFFK